MAAMIWDGKAQAFVEAKNMPMVYDQASEAWVETTGMVWDADAQAWEEAWGQRISAYVHGAALEIVTIKKDGIIVATVNTNAAGVSDEQIALGYGTYTLTGSVSGWTEEQTVDKDTTKFRAMPEGSLYWYGNECVDITGGWRIHYGTAGQKSTVLTKNTNDMFISYTSGDGAGNSGGCSSTNKIDTTRYSRLYADVYNVGGTEEFGLYVNLADTITSDGTIYARNYIKKSEDSPIIVDISGVESSNKTNYVRVNCQANKWANISAVWLE